MIKVIFKTALKTLLAVIIALILAFGIVSFALPSSMAGFFEKMGSYSIASGYSSLAYSYSGDIDDINRCVDDSVLAKDDDKIIKYCRKMVNHSEFERLCKESPEKRHYVYGNLCAAEYRTGDKVRAFDTALIGMKDIQDFPSNNPWVMLTIEVGNSKDKESAAKILKEIEKCAPSSAQQAAYDAALGVLNKLV